MTSTQLIHCECGNIGCRETASVAASDLRLAEDQSCLIIFHSCSYARPKGHQIFRQCAKYDLYGVENDPVNTRIIGRDDFF